MIGSNFSIPKALVGALAFCSTSSFASNIKPLEPDAPRVKTNDHHSMSAPGQCNSPENGRDRLHVLRVMGSDLFLRYQDLCESEHPLFAKDGKNGEVDVTIALLGRPKSVDEISHLALQSVKQDHQDKAPIEYVVFHQPVDAACTDTSRAMFAEMKSRGVKAILAPDFGPNYYPGNCDGVTVSKGLNNI